MNKIYQSNIPVLKNAVKRNIDGFTLIELLVVVLIIGILAAVALPQYRVAVEKSRATQLIARVGALYNAAQIYRMDTGAWPTDVRLLSVDVTAGAAKLDKTNISEEEHTGVWYKDGSSCMVNTAGAACQGSRVYIVHLWGEKSMLCNGNDESGEKACRSLGGGGVPRVIRDANYYEISF